LIQIKNPDSNPEYGFSGVAANARAESIPKPRIAAMMEPLLEYKVTMMMQEQEKDNFWLYIGALVIAAIVVVVMVRGSEHDKYVRQAQLEKEDTTNSAYIKK
jgi:hypothetical protein